MMRAGNRKLTEPLASVTYIFGGLALATAVLAALTTFAGVGSFGGFGRGADVCATQPNTGYGADSWMMAHLGIATQPGASLSIDGTLQACALHPSFYQRMLYTGTDLPSVLAWAAVLLLLWRLVRAADRHGPFTVPVAAGMRRLGWVIIIGTLAAASAQGAATDALLNTLLRAQTGFGEAVPRLSVLPVPLLAGAALLTFARIIRRGAAMDEEIRATV
ncbi:MAG: DUF2975 domain-containing protein [Actinobacteria bacterium]|nr:DUF2975 domain-containing protein [Actinomycetota bacterium]